MFRLNCSNHRIGAERSIHTCLKNGKALLFTLAEGATDPGELHALRLDTSEHKKVLDEASDGRVLPTGQLLFIRAASLWAAPFDTNRLEVTATPVPVVEGVRVEAGGALQYDVADDGTLIFVSGTLASPDQRTLQFVAGDGTIVTVPGAPRAYTGAKLSSDGTRVAVQIDVADAADVWVVDVTRGTLTRVTSETGYDGNPLWSPDGRHVAFLSSRSGRWTLNRKAADGTGNIEQLATLSAKTNLVYATAWAADGTLLVTVEADIGVVRSDGKGEWKPLIRTAAVETHAVLSPDGRWLAYMSNETGTGEIYLQRFPDLGERQLVSISGGLMPTWSHDGRTLTYLRGPSGPPREIMRVTIATSTSGPARIGTPAQVGDWRFYTTQFSPRTYDVLPDGRLLVIGQTSPDKSTAMRQINVVTNWFEELKRKVPIP